ncbi:odorant receptor 131-2-like [Acipenser ruthenus]|uniref:odorant receptor 131-2-like n=1 Tax=Acipenser ruthenus TaxID=7906 RepID=UPI002741F92C|nr:odorant receptor 131-2-like [Acipenser ruthenus]
MSQERYVAICFPLHHVQLCTVNRAAYGQWYIKIMLTARKAASDKSSASKGQRTVLLHGVQLILSMSFFIYPLTEYFLVGQPLEVMRHVLFFNYYVTLVLPKCLTPLIYGVRDENFKRHLKQYLCLCAKKVQPLGSN